uniref:CHK domain-containing protein n=1 Tax=Rhabditophanes sp. KR3021 TaxID=114890 RepID=A0AC35TFV4_9BILA
MALSMNDTMKMILEKSKCTVDWILYTWDSKSNLTQNDVSSIEATTLGRENYFIAQVYKIIIIFINDKLPTLTLALKVAGIKEEEKGDCSALYSEETKAIFHNREIDMYEKFISDMPELSTATYYGGKYWCPNQQVGLILLKYMDASPVPVIKGLNINQIKNALDQLQIMQAYFLCNTKDVVRDNFRPMLSLKEFIPEEDYFDIGWENVKKYLGNDSWKDIDEDVKGMRDHIHEIVKYNLTWLPHDDDTNVTFFVHGDYTMSNMCFKKAKDGSYCEEVDFVYDFQMISKGDLAYDVSRLISHSTFPAVRKEVEEVLLPQYFTDLKLKCLLEGKIVVPEITNQHTDLTDIIYKAYEKASVLYNKSNSDFVESSLSKGRTFAETHEIIFPALVSLFATETLLEKYGAYGISTKNTQLGNICSVHQIKCGNEDYRNADGHCNNILHPTWGATSSRFQRLITSKYVDNFNTQISSLTPNFATQIFEQRYQDYVKVTNIVTHWSNFVYHDIVKIQSSKAYLGNDIFSNLCCDPNNQHPECVPVNIPVEPSLNFNPTKCIPYIRTLVARRNELCEFGPREQGLHLNPRYLKSSFYNLFSQTSLDYPNLLVQLSKDHGLASYTEYREKCGGTVLHSFEDLYDSIIEPNRLIPLLKKNYKHVREVELAILGLAEKPVRGALVGPTFGCIIGKKYENYPLNSYAAIMKPRPESLALSRTAKLKMETIKIILNGEINVFEDPESSFESLSSSSIAAVISDIDIDTTLASNENETEICFPKNLPCDETYPYRLQHGWCNNLKNPQFATSFSPLVHLVPHEYENGIDVPRQISKSGKQLPMPRRISNMLNDDEPVFQKKYSHLVMQFGQFLDHEITHVATETGPNKTNVDCSPCDSQSTINRNCMPIDIPINDPHFPFYLESGERRCLPFIRSLLTHADNGVRNQVSQLTPYIDGSTIYGSSPCDADEVRLFKGGLLRWADLGPANREALPLRVNEGEGCRSHPDFSCFKAGEFRNTHQPGLTVIHNVFQREHNRIVRTLAEINPTWNDEKLFQEGRKILGAVYQHITYSEYVPLLAKYNLNVLNNGYFKGYDNECEASVSHPFATAAFRYGHTLVRSRFKRLNAYYQNHSEDFELKDNFDNAEPVHNYKTGGIDTILVGLLGAASMEFDRFVTNHLRNHLFARKGQKFSGFDLIAINIQRARDHGVAPYNKYREYCGFPKLKSFQDLSNDMDQETIDRIKSVYESVEDIDLFTGLITERSLKGALLSPTASCIISEQFDRLKKCDRFYYENDLPNTKFTEEQLREIRKASLATIFCDNSDILQKIQPNVFELPDDLTNAQIPCDDLARIDLKKWSEAPVCIMETTVLNLGEYRKKSPCLGCVCTKDGLRCETIKVTNCKKFYEENKTSDLMNDPACIIQCPMIKN